MNHPAPSIQPAFREPSRESQAVFRTVMEAMARPGLKFPLAAGFTPPAPLLPTAAAIVLTLADFETPLWLDGALAENEAVRAFLRFHTGARLVSDPVEAAFALIGDPVAAPPLDAFAQGSLEYPDRSTTIVFQVAELSTGGWRLEGPGISGHTMFSATPLRADFLTQFTDNRGQFPCGVDLIFAAPAAMLADGSEQTTGAIAALPRSTRLAGGF